MYLVACVLRNYAILRTYTITCYLLRQIFFRKDFIATHFTRLFVFSYLQFSVIILYFDISSF